MSGLIIDKVLSTTDPLTKEVSGATLILPQMSGFQPVVGIQVFRLADTGEFLAHLEAGKNTDRGVLKWSPIGQFNDEILDDETLSNFSTFWPDKSSKYRVRHVSGVNVHVLI